MQLIPLICSTLAAVALASPAEPAKRDTRNVYITTEAGWGGLQRNIPFGNGVTYSWANNVLPWFDGAWVGPASVGPDPGVCCILYDGNGTPSGTICNPGDSDLTGYWQFHTQQMKCWW